MTDLVFYHNPRCSKSRQAKALLDERGLDYQTRLYLKEAPSEAEVAELLRRLDGPASDLVRRKEAEYRAAGLDTGSDASAIAAAIARYPKLLERPILATPRAARIGRPPERILELL